MATAGPRRSIYQGMTIAFDFSVEEIWVPWIVGATLVPKPGGESLLGRGLNKFLEERHVTALCCVPTLLATLEEDFPGCVSCWFRGVMPAGPGGPLAPARPATISTSMARPRPPWPDVDAAGSGQAGDD